MVLLYNANTLINPIRYNKLSLAIPIILNLQGKISWGVIKSGFRMLENINTVESYTPHDHLRIREAYEFIITLFRLDNLSIKVLNTFKNLNIENEEAEKSNFPVLKEYDPENMELREELIKMLPEKIYELDSGYSNGLTIFDGICINECLLTFSNEASTINKAQLVLVILHELANWKRHNTQFKMNYLSITPKTLSGEAGYYYEESLFGFRIGNYLESITEKMAKDLLNLENWTDENRLKKIFEDIQVSSPSTKDSSSKSMINVSPNICCPRGQMLPIKTQKPLDKEIILMLENLKIMSDNESQ